MKPENLQFFYELLAHALWHADKPVDPEDFPSPPAGNRWQEILDYASAHSVAGIFGKALPLLPENWQPQSEMLSSLTKIISDDDHAYRRHADGLIHLFHALRTCTLQPLFFKSAVWASNYPHPEHLRIHDLAFFITPARLPDAIRCLEKCGATPEISYVPHEKRYLYQGLHCQLLSKTYEFASPRSRRYYQELESHAAQSAQICKFNLDGHWLPTFPPLFSIVCQTAYLQRQLLLGRITLRQICDWTMLLYSERTALGIAENQLLRHLKKLNLQRLYDALGNFALSYLGLPHGSYAALHRSPKEAAYGQQLALWIRELPKSGDITEPVCATREKWSMKAAHLSQLATRCRHLRHLCPQEWLFTPWKEFKAIFFPPHMR